MFTPLSFTCVQEQVGLTKAAQQVLQLSVATGLFPLWWHFTFSDVSMCFNLHFFIKLRSFRSQRSEIPRFTAARGFWIHQLIANLKHNTDVASWHIQLTHWGFWLDHMVNVRPERACSYSVIRKGHGWYLHEFIRALELIPEGYRCFLDASSHDWNVDEQVTKAQLLPTATTKY